eukprot:903255_1
MKVTTLFTLLCASSTSAFVAPAARPAVQTSLEATTNKNQHFENLSNIATVAAATITTTVLSSPLAAIAESDDYEYGAVDAPGGLGLAAGLGVLAILTAAVPVVLAPGEDAFNEMRDRDQFDDKRGR